MTQELLVELVEEVDDPNWATQLLVLDPNSQFRVVRSGRLDGRPSEFRVMWTGRDLRVIVPQGRGFRSEHAATA